jgi:CRP-like cAMP-binding protein
VDRDQVLFRLLGTYCPEGTILYTEGAPGEEMYFVQSGAVRLGPDHPGGPDSHLGPGATLAEETFFGRAPRARRAEVLSDSRLLRISDRTVDAVVRHGPETALAVLGRLVALEEAVRADAAAWSLSRVLRRVEPFLPRAAGAVVDPAVLAEDAGVPASDARLLFTELERVGAAVRQGAHWRLPDPELLERAVGEIAAAGQPA